MRALNLVGVLLEEAVAEDAELARVRLELLHDEVVVLAGVDVATVLAQRVARREILRRAAAPLPKGTPCSRLP